MCLSIRYTFSCAYRDNLTLTRPVRLKTFLFLSKHLQIIFNNSQLRKLASVEAQPASSEVKSEINKTQKLKR